MVLIFDNKKEGINNMVPSFFICIFRIHPIQLLFIFNLDLVENR